MKELPLMACGHVANGVDMHGNPVCVICYGITPGAIEIEPAPPSLEGRKARCTYYGHAFGNRGKCQSEKDSSLALAFFKTWPDRPFDEFYCGCAGWD